MDKAQCIQCGNTNEVKVSTGFKKPENKGKKYFTCVNCGEFQWVEANSKPTETEHSEINQTTINKEEKPDWDAISRGKVRNAVATAFIANKAAIMDWKDIELTDEVKQIMEPWVTWIIEDK